MGIDYLSCRHCGESFPDVNEYVYCECGNTWCDEECAEADGFINESCKLGYECDSDECDRGYCSSSCENFIPSSCAYCREEKFDDSELLNYALTELNITKAKLTENYKNSKSE